MVIRKTRRKARQVVKALTRDDAGKNQKGPPRFDLREDLRREVTRAHKRIDRIHTRGERLRALYRKDLNLRWLSLAEQTGMGSALQSYKQAATRAALINRLYNVVEKRRRIETCERQVLAFVQKQVASDHLDKRSIAASLKFAHALFRYIHVESSRQNDKAVRQAWRKLGPLVKRFAPENDFLFEIPAGAGAASGPARRR